MAHVQKKEELDEQMEVDFLLLCGETDNVQLVSETSSFFLFFRSAILILDYRFHDFFHEFVNWFSGRILIKQHLFFLFQLPAAESPADAQLRDARDAGQNGLVPSRRLH